MEIIFDILIVGFILVFWVLSNAFNKPVLNKMMNYYEDDEAGRQTANLFIAIMLVLSFVLGSRIF